MAPTREGTVDSPIWARTSVLCNGQICQKVENSSAISGDRKTLEPAFDAAQDLYALNSLQVRRDLPLSSAEIMSPLRHVWESLPEAVRETIYLGDSYGSLNRVFSCDDAEFEDRHRRVLGTRIVDGRKTYADFWRRARAAQYLLFSVSVAKGHWLAVVARLRRGKLAPPADMANEPFTPLIFHHDYNEIPEWTVVGLDSRPTQELRLKVAKRFIRSAEQADMIVNRTVRPPIWTPRCDATWETGLRAFALVKTLLHRITDVWTQDLFHQKSFWDPMPGWLDVDEVRAEMMGRAASRILMKANYEARIAIEGLDMKKAIIVDDRDQFNAHRLRPTAEGKRAYVPGLKGKGEIAHVPSRGPRGLDPYEDEEPAKPKIKTSPPPDGWKDEPISSPATAIKDEDSIGDDDDDEKEEEEEEGSQGEGGDHGNNEDGNDGDYDGGPGDDLGDADGQDGDGGDDVPEDYEGNDPDDEGNDSDDDGNDNLPPGTAFKALATLVKDVDMDIDSDLDLEEGEEEEAEEAESELFSDDGSELDDEQETYEFESQAAAPAAAAESDDKKRRLEDEDLETEDAGVPAGRKRVKTSASPAPLPASVVEEEEEEEEEGVEDEEEDEEEGEEEKKEEVEVDESGDLSEEDGVEDDGEEEEGSYPGALDANYGTDPQASEAEEEDETDAGE